MPFAPACLTSVTSFGCQPFFKLWFICCHTACNATYCPLYFSKKGNSFSFIRRMTVSSDGPYPTGLSRTAECLYRRGSRLSPSVSMVVVSKRIPSFSQVIPHISEKASSIIFLSLAMLFPEHQCPVSACLELFMGIRQCAAFQVKRYFCLMCTKYRSLFYMQNVWSEHKRQRS